MKTAKNHLDEALAQIYSSSEALSNRIDKIKVFSKGKSRIFISEEELELLVNSSEKLSRACYDVQFWNQALYERRGKSSQKKKITSAENGKKGGRPPKEITIARRRVEELEDLDRVPLSERTEEIVKEHDTLVCKIQEWESSKGIAWSFFCWD